MANEQALQGQSSHLANGGRGELPTSPLSTPRLHNIGDNGNSEGFARSWTPQHGNLPAREDNEHNAAKWLTRVQGLRKLYLAPFSWPQFFRTAPLHNEMASRKCLNSKAKLGTKNAPKCPRKIVSLCSAVYRLFTSTFWFRKRWGVQKSMGHKVPWKTGMLIYLPVTSWPLISLQTEVVLWPCNFATTHWTACIQNFLSLELRDPWSGGLLVRKIPAPIKIKSALPPPKPKIPPPKKTRNFMDMVFLQKERIFQAPIKLAQPFPAHTWIFLTLAAPQRRHRNVRKILGTPGCTNRGLPAGVQEFPFVYYRNWRKESFLLGHRPRVSQAHSAVQEVYVIFSYLPFVLPRPNYTHDHIRQHHHYRLMAHGVGPIASTSDVTS